MSPVDIAMNGTVAAVHLSAVHAIAKHTRPEITLLAGIGVHGDAHAGAKVQHRWLARRDPSLPNLRQVHLMPAELLEELALAGFAVAPGRLGENITTRGVPLLELPTGARLRMGEAVVELTGLRGPCKLLESIQPGLMEALLERDAGRIVRRKAGVMGIVVTGGAVRAGATLDVVMPALPHRPLAPV